MNGYPIKVTARFALQGQPCKRRLGYRQYQVLNYINQVMAAAGLPPSYNMIRDEFGIEKGNVSRIVADLERRGYVKLLGRIRLGWRVRNIATVSDLPDEMTLTKEDDMLDAHKITCSIKDATEMTGIAKTTLYSLMKEGRITSTTIGTKRLIHVESLRRLLGAPSDSGPAL